MCIRDRARAFCRASIGQVSHLPVLRLAPVKEERNNCPFLTENHCVIHDAEPLVCALYPLAQEISREGDVSYFLQPTGCGGRVIEAKVEDYLARYDVPAREKTDVRWAQTCMDLEDVVEPLDAALEPPLRRRMQAKLWQALYFKFDYESKPPVRLNLWKFRVIVIFNQSNVIFYPVISAPFVRFCNDVHPLHVLKPCKNRAEIVYLLPDK